MRFITALMLIVSLATSIAAGQDLSDAPQAAESSSPAALFERHAAGGTLFAYETAQQFLQNGWGKEYAVLLRQRWKGESQAAVGLALKPLKDHTYRVGQPFDCLATIKNSGDKPLTLDVGGSCGMTHALGLGWCRGQAGGPHCKCQARFEHVEPGRSTALETGFATMAAINWTPEKPGEYIVIGTYTLPPEDGKQRVVYSAPLVIDVVGRK